MGDKTTSIISIWTWVGIMLGVYGTIVFITGLASIGSTDAIVVRGHNPALWWGALMLAAGAFFLYIGLRAPGQRAIDAPAYDRDKDTAA